MLKLEQTTSSAEQQPFSLWHTVWHDALLQMLTFSNTFLVGNMIQLSLDIGVFWASENNWFVSFDSWCCFCTEKWIYYDLYLFFYESEIYFSSLIRLIIRNEGWHKMTHNIKASTKKRQSLFFSRSNPSPVVVLHPEPNIMQ